MTYLSSSKGVVSTSNSSTTVLSSGTTFTGDWEKCSEFSTLVVAVKTDADGVYTIQFSPDGTNADSTLTRYYRTSQIEPPHRFTVTRKYFRVTFTNNGTQTYFRLQTTLGNHKDLNIPLDSTISQDYDSISVRPTDYTTEVALGRRQGATTWNKFGYNTDVDIGTEVVAAFGGTFQYSKTGQTISIVSDSTSDTNTAGAGARQLIIYGVDANWDAVTEVVALNGTTPVVTSSLWIGINRIAIYTSGSNNVNVGTITITGSASGYTMTTMPAGGGVSQQLIFYVPKDTQFLATWMRLVGIKSSGGGSPVITFKAYVYSNVVDSYFEVYNESLDTSVQQYLDVKPSEPFIIGEKSIFWVTATVVVNNVSVSGRFSGKTIKDVDA